MTPDAALDNLAFFVGLRLMGPDNRRRLHLTLLREPEVRSPAKGVIERIERLDALLDHRREPETLQDRLDLARAERERSAPPFDPVFWLTRMHDLIVAGFDSQQAAQIVQTVRRQVDADHEQSLTREEENDFVAQT